MGVERLTVDMKAALALIASWIVFLVAGSVVALATGPFDIYIVVSLVVAVPFAVLFWFGWNMKREAYLGSALLGVVLVLVTPASIDASMTPLLLWETMFSTLLLTLVSLEAFKAYLQFSNKP